MKVYMVRCWHGAPMVFQDKRAAEREVQEHVIDNECETTTLEETEMSEAEFDALPEHLGW